MKGVTCRAESVYLSWKPEIVPGLCVLLAAQSLAFYVALCLLLYVFSSVFPFLPWYCNFFLLKIFLCPFGIISLFFHQKFGNAQAFVISVCKFICT